MPKILAIAGSYRENSYKAPDGGIALLMYDDVRKSDDPRAGVLELLESSYQAGARLGGWRFDDLSWEASSHYSPFIKI